MTGNKCNKMRWRNREIQCAYIFSCECVSFGCSVEPCSRDVVQGGGPAFGRGKRAARAT